MKFVLFIFFNYLLLSSSFVSAGHLLIAFDCCQKIDKISKSTATDHCSKNLPKSQSQKKTKNCCSQWCCNSLFTSNDNEWGLKIEMVEKPIYFVYRDVYFDFFRPPIA